MTIEMKEICVGGHSLQGIKYIPNRKDNLATVFRTAPRKSGQQRPCAASAQG